MAEVHQSASSVRAASMLPVIEGALAFIVISFVSSVWENIPVDKQHFAFEVVYASGAHFLFSFFLSVPMLLLSRGRSAAVSGAMILGTFAYVFWSLNEQHRGLANMLLADGWRIPLPFGEQVSATLSGLIGPGLAMCFSPLIFSVAVTMVAVPVAWLVHVALGAFSPRR